MFTRLASLTLTVALALWHTDALGARWSDVTINGLRLTDAQLELLQASAGATLEPGAYVIDGSSCWKNLTRGTAGCFSDFRYLSGDIHRQHGDAVGDGAEDAGALASINRGR